MKKIGIAEEHEILGKLTVFSKSVAMSDGYVEIKLNIRYPLGTTFEKIVDTVSTFLNKYDFEISDAVRGTDPYLLDKDSEITKILCGVANSVTGEDKKPYTLSGGTYAHRLPNAYAFGGSGNCPPSDFKPGHGGAHGIDESVSLDRLQRMMKIYARALLELDKFF